jgi:multidrug efflux system membrane fusion protein
VNGRAGARRRAPALQQQHERNVTRFQSTLPVGASIAGPFHCPCVLPMPADHSDPAFRPAAAPAPRRRRHGLGALVAVLAVIALFALAWHLTHRAPPAGAGFGARAGGGRGAGGRGGAPVTVGVATAQRGDIPQRLEALGTVAPAATVTVRPQVSGTLERLLYRDGQMVKAGQVLATIDARSFEIALAQAQGQRQRDAAQLDNARLTLARYQTLLQQDSIARQDVDTQAALVKQLEGTVTMDRAAENTARLNLSYTRITAPVAGRVGLHPVDAGNLVSTSDAAGVATITQLAPIDVVFAVPQAEVPTLMARQAAGATLPVTALDSSRTRTLDQGSFLTLDNQVDVQTGTVKAKARFGNAQAQLFPNQFVNVRLLVDTLRGAVTVPVTAVRTGPQGDFVWVLNGDHTVSQRSVKRGPATVDQVAITQGLQLGEQVITEGADRLRDGARVMLPGDWPRGASDADGAGSGAGGRWHHRGASGSGAAGAGERGAADAGARPASGASGWHRAGGAASGPSGRQHRASGAGGAAGNDTARGDGNGSSDATPGR